MKNCPAHTYLTYFSVPIYSKSAILVSEKYFFMETKQTKNNLKRYKNRTV